jgi:RND superfamily putative drug exporter
LVFIFQQGHFQGLLNFQATGYLDTTVPIILFCIVFGLSMDYEIFLLSRIKEVYDAGGDNTQSVGEGLEHTGAIITSAALILVLVAGAFATGQVVFIKALGIGVAVAVLLDASIVRALLVPALMRIMGDWNWWAPRWLQRLLPDWRTPG